MKKSNNADWIAALYAKRGRGWLHQVCKIVIVNVEFSRTDKARGNSYVYGIVRMKSPKNVSYYEIRYFSIFSVHTDNCLTSRLHPFCNVPSSDQIAKGKPFFLVNN